MSQPWARTHLLVSKEARAVWCVAFVNKQLTAGSADVLFISEFVLVIIVTLVINPMSIREFAVNFCVSENVDIRNFT
jgi:hypothetical protein